MADPNQSKGFTLPPPATPGGQPTKPAPESPISQALKIMQGGIERKADTLPQARDYAIAGGAMLVLVIAFFFAKRAYANYLAKGRVSAGSANAAGWCLFIFLTTLAGAAVLSILSPSQFFTPVFMGPLGVISLGALILMFVVGRRS